MLKEFKTFIARGNVLELAVAVMVGAAFATIVKSLTDDILMPIIGWLSGGFDFSSYFVRLGPVPAGFTGSTSDYAALKAAGVPIIGYGAFITVAINFVILALIVFLIVRTVNRAIGARPVIVEDPAEITLLREIRDELRAR